MVQRQGKAAVQLDLAIDDLYEHARQNLADQRATILQLTAATSEQQIVEHAQHVAAAARLPHTHSDANPRRDDDSNDTSITGKSLAADFLQQVMRRYDDNGDASQQQCDQVEQRRNDQLRNAPVLAAAAVRKSHTKTLSSHQRKPIRPTKKTSSDDAGAIADENWSVKGWGVETPAMDGDGITLAHGQLLQQ
jgi:hypothetical protein